MATMQNNSPVDFVLYTKEGFNGASDGSLQYQNTGDIVFLPHDNAIYLNGTYYGLTPDMKSQIDNILTDVTNIKGKVGSYQSLTTTLIGIVSNLRKSLDGGSIEDGVPEGSLLLWDSSSTVIKDAKSVKEAIDILASKIAEVGGVTFAEVTKPEGAGKFATSVTQDTTGAIKAEYADATSADIKRTPTTGDTDKVEIQGNTVEEALQNIAKEVKSAENAAILKGNGANENINSGSQVSISTVQDIVNLIGNEVSALLGASNDWGATEQKTLGQLRTLIKTNAEGIEDIRSLFHGEDGSIDLSNVLEQLSQIKNELDAGDGSITSLLDGLRLFLGFGSTFDSTTGGKFQFDNQTYSTFKSIVDMLLNKIEAVSTQLGGFDAKIDSAIDIKIGDLDATVRGNLTESDTVDSGKHVGVKVVEENGKLTSVTVVENDIASASELSSLSSEVTNVKNQINNFKFKWNVIS